MSVSNFVLSILAKTGEAPPVDTETVTGPRSSMDGKMKSQISGRSTTFTRIFISFASLAICVLSFSSFVAAIIKEKLCLSNIETVYSESMKIKFLFSLNDKR